LRSGTHRAGKVGAGYWPLYNDLRSIEATLTVALGHLVSAEHPAAQFLLSKASGLQKTDLLEDALKAKGYSLSSKSPLREALGSIMTMMNFRNRLVHDAVLFHRDDRKWYLGKGAAAGDRHFGNRCELTPELLKGHCDRAHAAVRGIALEMGLPYVE
jgi:hypothetical protein